MLSKKFWGAITSLGLLLEMTLGVQAAEMPANPSGHSQFYSIEQPLELKIVVTIGGLALIGLELWWFLFSETKHNKP